MVVSVNLKLDMINKKNIMDIGRKLQIYILKMSLMKKDYNF